MYLKEENHHQGKVTPLYCCYTEEFELDLLYSRYLGYLFG